MKKNIILGLEKPRFGIQPNIKPKHLLPKQLALLNKALSAKDYFLLQGPPGTGKTKYLLKEMVAHLYQNTNQRIVLLAYTNRAVDEICSAIKTIQETPFFVRLGYGESTEHGDVLLNKKTKGKGLKDIRTLLTDCRVYVATVLTFLKNIDIIQRLSFDTAIVDEASQLLEPQIVGILGKVKRFILIGDEKQLPAVVIQNECTLINQNIELKTIGIDNLSVSLFERLLKNCKQKEWTNAFGMLQDQGRMHKAILDFPNSYFYNKKLSVINSTQQKKFLLPLSEKTTQPIEKILQQYRSFFIATKPEKKWGVSTNEAKWVTRLVAQLKQLLGTSFDENSIGVITPFRAQIGEIKKQFGAYPTLKNVPITVETVERYQGSERNVIVISFAANYEQQMPNLSVKMYDIDGNVVDRKLNVALTRAKDYLILIGCPKVLETDGVYAKLINFYRKKGTLFAEKDLLLKS